MTPAPRIPQNEATWDFNSARLLAHDLKSPIAVFEMLQSQLNFGREEHQHLYRLALERLYELTGRLTHRNDGLTTLSLRESLENTARLIRGDHQNLGAQIALDVEGDTKLPCGYLTQLNRVVGNLIQNSIESYSLATIPKPVTLKVRILEKSLRIEVSDEGCGMDEIELQRALLGGFTTKASGNGLGLSSAKRWCEEFGGRFAVESMNQKGTRVFLELPISL